MRRGGRTAGAYLAGGCFWEEAACCRRLQSKERTAGKHLGTCVYVGM